MTNNEPPPNSNDDGFQQLSFFAAPNNSDAETVDEAIESKTSEEKPDALEMTEAKAAIAVDEQATDAKISEPAKKTRAKSKIVKPASTQEREKDTAALTEAKEELAKLPAVEDSRRTVIMNVTEPELKIDFEASLAELETVVKELDGEVKLEKALQLFEQGIKLSVECEQFIKGAEAKIEILKKQADGSLATEVFQGERVDLDD